MTSLAIAVVLWGIVIALHCFNMLRLRILPWTYFKLTAKFRVYAFKNIFTYDPEPDPITQYLNARAHRQYASRPDPVVPDPEPEPKPDWGSPAEPVVDDSVKDAAESDETFALPEVEGGKWKLEPLSSKDKDTIADAVHKYNRSHVYADQKEPRWHSADAKLMLSVTVNGEDKRFGVWVVTKDGMEAIEKASKDCMTQLREHLEVLEKKRLENERRENLFRMVNGE